MAVDGDKVIYSTSPPLPFGKITRGFEGDAEDYKKVRDIKLPISERGDALTRICEVVSRGENTDVDTRKTVLRQIFKLFIELGNQKSANILTDLLFDSSREISALVMTNIATFVAKTNDKDFEATIYAVAEDLGIVANEQSTSIPSEKYNAIQDAAKYLMKNYSSQFVPAIFAPGSIAKGSLKWLAANYRTLKSEIFGDDSEACTNADRVLMAALKSASSQLADTIDKAMISMDALTTVAKSVQSVLGIYSDLLRTSGEPGIVIVSTALASSSPMSQAIQPHQPQPPEKLRMGFSRRGVGRDRDSTSSQVSPTTLTPLTRRFSSGIDVSDNRTSTPVNRQHPPETCTGNDTGNDAGLSLCAAPPHDPGTPSNPRTQQTPALTRHKRSSSAPPTPTPVKRAFSQTDVPDNESKRSRKEEYNSKTPSPTHSSQRQGSGTGRGGTEPYRGNSGRGYQGKNFIPGFRARGNFRGRSEPFRSSSWRGRPQWNGRSEYQGYSRGSDYLPRMSYD